MVAPPRTSAAGILSLLSESDLKVQQYALTALNSLVSQFWTEISEFIPPIEEMYESAQLPKESRDLAALVLSKVFYNLGQYDEALSFALRSGNAFQVESMKIGSEEYAETIVSKAIDRYTELRTSSSTEEYQSKEEETDVRLQEIVENIFTRCIEEGEYKQALGIAIESSRLDIVTRIYEKTKDVQLLSYVIDAVLDSGFKLAYRNKVLHHVIPQFPAPTIQSPHIQSLTRLHITLASPDLTIQLLSSLVTSTSDKNCLLLAYQMAFDLAEGGAQEYIESIRAGLPQTEEYEKLRKILSGEESIRLYLDFLNRNNRADLLILKTTKDALDGRSSIYHNALSLQNAYMHCGTASDAFLRNNLDWLGRASNWGKFSVTASLGVINKGNTWDAMRLLGPYLPSSDVSPSEGSGPYSEGGALYALGLIHAGRGKDVIGYLRDRLREASSEVVQHGAALGLGVAGMASGNADAYEDLRTTLFSDSAVAGEASGYAMGLLMLGSASNKCVDEMLHYAKETQHEKIIRGLAMGVAFLFYGRQEEADSVIDTLLSDKDSILRYGGVYTLALAYSGTADNSAVKKLLHIAVSDTSDDVRRAAVTSLAFLLYKTPQQVPRLVQLLAESYNPHVRCGATIALGLACAGSGNEEAIGLLEPMAKDPVDFVRQGALMALGMILIQQAESKASSTRTLFAKIITDKHEDSMARYGAAVAQGLIDAGGRNVTISLSAGRTNAIVGMALFCQFWYWYPLAHCASLAFEPTAVIGLTESLQPPVFEFVSNAKPSLFAYPSATKPPTKETIEKVATAVLSTTAKARAREREKEKEKAKAEAGSSMDTDEKKPAVVSEPKKDDDDTAMKVDEQPPEKPTKKPREPSSEKLSNLSRVTPAQLSYIVFPTEGRFQPVRPTASKGGILMLLDKTPGDPTEYMQPSSDIAQGPSSTTSVAEAAPPPPFEYPFGQDM